jgi:hypothetical protein
VAPLVNVEVTDAGVEYQVTAEPNRVDDEVALVRHADQCVFVPVHIQEWKLYRYKVADDTVALLRNPVLQCR